VRVLGIDYGTVRLGLAMSDEEEILASPLPCQRRTHSLKHDLRRLTKLAAEYGVHRIVIGLPLNADGSQGPMAEETLAFADRLKQAIDLPIEMVDERLTTDEVERVLIRANLSRQKRKGLRDSLAAVLILQDHLNRERSESLTDRECS